MERLVAIQAQYSRNVALTLLARLPSLQANWVDEALNSTHELIKTWCLRSTVHVLSARDLSLIVAALGGEMSRDFYYFMQTRRAISERSLDGLAKQIMEALASGALTREELHKKVKGLSKIQGAAWGLDVKDLAFRGDLVFAGNHGSTFSRRDKWIPAIGWRPPSEEQGQRNLLLRYLRGYGPASVQDFAYWSGLRIGRAKSIFEETREHLTSVSIGGIRNELYLREQDLKLLEDRAEPQEIIFLPKFDPLMMAHRDSTRFLSPTSYKRVFRAAAQVEATLLLRGQVSATWRMKELKTKLVLNIEPFKAFNSALRKKVTDKAQKFADFYSLKLAEVIWST